MSSGHRNIASPASDPIDNTIAVRARTSTTRYRSPGSSRFRVYDREDDVCLNGDCGGTIKRRTQAGRSTFYCPTCQH